MRRPHSSRAAAPSRSTRKIVPLIPTSCLAARRSESVLPRPGDGPPRLCRLFVTFLQQCGARRSFAPGHVALATRPRPLEHATLGDEAARNTPLIVLHPPGKQLLAIGQYQRQVGRIPCAIVELSRILPEVEEQRCQAGEVHVLVALVADDIE